MKLLVLLFISLTSQAQPIIFGSGGAQNLTNSMAFKNGVKEISGSLNPTSSTVNAPVGSLYLSTSTGKAYIKKDAGSSTNWGIVADTYSLTSGAAIKFNGSGLEGVVGTSNGQVLTWDGSTWYAAAPSGGSATYKVCGATIAANGTVNYESDDCVDSCSWNSGNGRTTCNWKAGFWSVQPNCSVTAWQSTGDHRGVSILGNDTTSFVYRVSAADSSQQNQITSFTCIGD
jgi:hypothetical protein